MTDIEERAWEKYPEVIKHHNLAQIDINEEKRKRYIANCKEQRAIDIEKFKKVFFSYMKMPIMKFYNPTSTDAEGLWEEIVKAMEE